MRHWHVLHCFDGHSATSIQFCGPTPAGASLSRSPMSAHRIQTQLLNSILKIQSPPFIFSSKTPAKCLDWFFSREFIGSHHTDKNSMSKELGVSKRRDDAMRHFDQIPSWIWRIHPNGEGSGCFWFELVLKAAEPGTNTTGLGVAEAGIFVPSLLLTSPKTWANSHGFAQVLVSCLKQPISKDPRSS